MDVGSLPTSVAYHPQLRVSRTATSSYVHAILIQIHQRLKAAGYMPWHAASWRAASSSYALATACFHIMLRILEDSYLSLWRFFFSLGPQTWQNSQLMPDSQPLVWKKAQGLQIPEKCVAEPTDGHLAEPSGAGGSGTGGCISVWAGGWGAMGIAG